MSVTSTVEKSVEPNGVETYDSGDDWEIGVGNLIIDLDADLEKDRQKLEMNRFVNSKGSSKDCEGLAPTCSKATSAISGGLTFPSVQPPGPSGNYNKENGKSKVKRSKTCKDICKSASAPTLFGLPDIYAGKTQDAQGRPGEAFGMNSALGQAVSNPNTSDVTVSCAKGKEEKNGKNQTRGLKRERDVARAKKEKQDVKQTSPDFSPVSGNRCGFAGKGSPCHCGDNGIGDISKSGMDSGIMGNTIVGKKNDDEIGTPAKKLKTEKVEPLFPAPALPPSTAQAPPPYAPSSPPISSPSEQLLVRTRSIGTNTRETGNGTDPACLGPCEPGTSVNLEGIVWHETEEGVLVVNVTWRKRTYVGTLLDCTRHDWAPPRFCESPSDFEMRGGRGRGKRMRLAIPNIPGVEPGFPKVRGMPHKSRGGAIHSKGRRGSLNLISSCKSPPFFTVEELKPGSLMAGKRKSKPPADLDLSLVGEDTKTGKRIRAKSRSAPSTPQGKSDPTFLDQGCSSPTLIDCPHPNCNKKYKHINGLRYHQTHAHLDIDRKMEFEVESEDRFSDCEESFSNISLECTESNCSSLKKPSPLCKMSTLGVPKNRRVMLGNDGGTGTNSKTRRNSGTKGLVDSLSNLPIISNMTVVLENCLVTDRSSSAEMPKLEAEGLIDKKGASDKSKKANGKTDKCSSKAKTTRPIAPAPPPPKLIAIPTAAFATNATGAIAQRSTSVTAVTHTTAKSPPLKPIKPKATVLGEPGLANASLVTCKDNRRKEKRRLKDRGCKEVRSPKSDNKLLKPDDGKVAVKEFPVSLLKEHLSKQEVANGLSESQESRMASIRAEADKVYTFTDNAPSPSIGGSSRLDSGVLANGDGATNKTNSPAYSDISDAADDGGLDSRSEGARSKTSLPADINANKEGTVKGFPTTPPQAAPGKEPQSPYYHGYDPYYLPGYMHTGQPNASAFPNSTSTHEDKTKKEETKEGAEDKEKADFSEAKKADAANSSSQSHLQLAMTQTQTALAQSLYYGQYARGLYMDQKLLMVSNSYRQPYEKYYDNQQFEQKAAPLSNREGEQSKEDAKQKMNSSAVASKATDGPKSCCGKPAVSNAEESGRPQLPTAQHHQGKSASINEAENQQLVKESGDMKPATEPVKQTTLEPKLPFAHESEGQSWYNPYQSTYAEQQTQEVVEEVSADKAKGRDVSPGSLTQMEAEPEDAKRQDAHPGCTEDSGKLEEQEAAGAASGDSRNARVAVSSPMNPHQSYIQYQHAYPYLQMCDPSNTAYRVMSPALVHNYPGFHYPLYGKTAGREESEVAHSSRGITNKPPCDSTALELLQHHNLPYHGKSPAPGERGSPERERETERDREHAPFARHLHTHHHTHLGVGYPLIPGQYDPYQGLSSTTLVSNQQVPAQTSAAGNDGKI
ncbi:zinc finger protein 608 isoform X1 [Anguilla anguilla]|uniref:zinc finger protein 608 isoform X1 n=1 Tax=Anguilla anguilla TaxID=7936 RepID=UPI0015A828C0|nr:zinc finger protein 608 isoform X1 [Anguilla anguilla]